MKMLGILVMMKIHNHQNIPLCAILGNYNQAVIDVHYKFLNKCKLYFILTKS